MLIFWYLQVDDGNWSSPYGYEIPLRTKCEALAVSGKSVDPDADMHDIEGNADDGSKRKFKLGWEGVKAPELDVEDVEDAKTESGHLICLCFQGGPGSIDTVKVCQTTLSESANHFGRDPDRWG